jgi:hypothetical protein
MKATEHSKWLRYPAYGLYHLDSLDQSERGAYLYDIVPTFDSRFDMVAQQSILEALAWAVECDGLNWEEVLPGLPHSTDFKREHCRITRDRILRRQKTT